MGEISDFEDSDEEEEDDDEDFNKTEMVMQDDWEAGCVIRDCLIPHAVRWYTGEACESVKNPTRTTRRMRMRTTLTRTTAMTLTPPPKRRRRPRRRQRARTRRSASSSNPICHLETLPSPSYVPLISVPVQPMYTNHKPAIR